MEGMRKEYREWVWLEIDIVERGGLSAMPQSQATSLGWSIIATSATRPAASNWYKQPIVVCRRTGDGIGRFSRWTGYSPAPPGIQAAPRMATTACQEPSLDPAVDPPPVVLRA